MTKEEAHKEAIARWRKLPIMERQTYLQAQTYGRILAESLDFHTMGDPLRVITSWLVADIAKTEAAAKQR